MAKDLSKTNIQNLLHNGIVNIKFTKVDGSTRLMKCTLMENFITKYDNKTERKKQPNNDVVSVWDVEKNNWRSFRYDSIIDVYK